MANVLRNLMVMIGANATGLDRELTTALGKTKRFGAEMAGIGASMSAAITLPIAGVGLAALKSAAEMDSLTRGLKAVTKDAGPLESQLKRLEQVAKLPGLGFTEAIQGSIRLQAAGFSANMAERSLKAFGNALATVGKGKADLDGVTLALSQIASKGKISAEEINQLAERVPQIRKAIEEAFGKGAGGFDAKQWAEMGVSAEEFVEKVTSALEKVPPVTSGVANSFENFSDAATKALAKVGESILKNFAVEERLNSAAEAVDRAAKAFGGLSPAAQTTIVSLGGLMAAAGPVVWILGTLIEKTATVINFFRQWDIVAKIAAVAMNPITLAIAGLLYHMNGIIRMWQELRKEWENDAFLLRLRDRWKDMEQAADSNLQRLKPLVPAMALVKSKATEVQSAVTGAAGAHTSNAAAIASEGEAYTAHLPALRRYTEATHQQWVALQQRKQAAANWSIQDIEPPDLTQYGDVAKTVEEITKAQYGLNEALKIGEKQFPKVAKEAVKAGQQQKTVLTEVQREVRRAFDGMSRGMADAIVQWKGFGDSMKRIAQSFASGVLEIFIQRLLDPLQKKLADVLGGIIGGSSGTSGVIKNATGGGSGVAGAISGGGGAGGGVAAAGSGLMGAVNMVSGIVGAVSSVIGNFQMAGMNKSLDLIEKEVRYSQIHLLNLLEKANVYWPFIEHTHQRLVELNDIRTPIMEIRDALKALKIDVRVSMDGRQITAGVVSQLKLEGALA